MIAVAAAPPTGTASDHSTAPAGDQAPVVGAIGASEQPSFGSVLAREAVGDQNNAPSPMSGTVGAKSHKADDAKKVKDEDTAPSPLALYAQTPVAATIAQLLAPLPWPAMLDGGTAGSGPITKEGSAVAGIQTIGGTPQSATARGDLPTGLDRATGGYAGRIQGRSAVGSAWESSNAALPAGNDTRSGGSVGKHALHSGMDIASGGSRGEIKTKTTDPATPSNLADRTAPAPSDDVTHIELGKSGPPPTLTTIEAIIPGSDQGKTRESNRGEESIKPSLVRSDPGKSEADADPALAAPAATRTRDVIPVRPRFMSSPLISLPDKEARTGGANPIERVDSGVRTAGVGAGTSNRMAQPIAVTASTTTGVPTTPTHTSARSANAHAGTYAASPARITAAPSIIHAEHVQPSAPVAARGTAGVVEPVNLIPNQPAPIPNPAFGSERSTVPMRLTPVGMPRSAGSSAAPVSGSDKDRRVDSTDTAHGDPGITPNWPGLPSAPAAPSSAPLVSGNTTAGTGAGVSLYQPIVQGVLVHGASLHVLGAASSFNVVLTPPSLGMVTVHVAQGQTGLQVVITPHQSDTTALLNQHLPDLVGMLKQGGQDLPVQAQIVQTHGAAPSPAGTPQAASAGQSGLNFATNSGGQSFAGQQGNTDQRAWAAAAGDLFGRPDQGNTAITPTADRLPARMSALARIDLHA